MLIGFAHEDDGDYNEVLITPNCEFCDWHSELADAKIKHLRSNSVQTIVLNMLVKKYGVFSGTVRNKVPIEQCRLNKTHFKNKNG